MHKIYRSPAENTGHCQVDAVHCGRTHRCIVQLIANNYLKVETCQDILHLQTGLVPDLSQQSEKKQIN